MKIVRYSGGKIGVVVDGLVHDVTAVCNVDTKEWPPMGMVRTIADFPELRSKIEAAVKSSPGTTLDESTLEMPLPWPHNLFAFPANYVAHTVEMKSTNRADKNGFFLKTTSSLSGPNDPIVLPDFPGREIHHECELGMIIGKRGRNISRENALDYIFGYTCLIDVTLRGTEERVMRKSWDTFTPIGPWLVTADEVGDASNLWMKLWVNGEIRHDANTKDLIVDIPGMIECMSNASTLEPGDIVATGTPAGVGPIKPGDTVVIEIQNVGKMTLPVVAAPVAAGAR